MNRDQLIKHIEDYNEAIVNHIKVNNSRTNPSAFVTNIDIMFTLHRKNPGLLTDAEFIEYAQQGLELFALYLGAAKDLQLVRDGQISKHVSVFNNILEDVQAMNPDVSQLLMSKTPKAYIGVNKEWSAWTQLAI